MSQSKKRRKPLEPFYVFHMAADQLRGGYGNDAIRILFEASEASDLPAPWAKALKSLTRQVRRIVSHNRKARAAFASGDRAEGLRQIALAQEVLAKAPVGLSITFSGGMANTVDFGAVVLKGAEEMLSGTRRQRHS